MRPRHLGPAAFASLLLTLLAAPPAAGQGPPCRPCGGVVVDDPEAAARSIRRMADFQERHPLYVSWDVGTAPEAREAREGEPAPAVAASRRLRDAGATPWMRLIFTTPPPLLDRVEALDRELETVAALARDAAEDTHFQLVWRPEGEAAAAPGPAEMAFFVKRAAVAVTGARPGATVIAGPFPAEPAFLRELYAQDVAAYMDGVALEPGTPDAIGSAVETLGELDPGRPVVVDGLPLPRDPARALARAAELARRGVAVALFDVPEAGPETVAPFVTLARELRGDLSYDPGYALGGTAAEPSGAWTFVRGEDLALRTIVELDSEALEPGTEVRLTYSDPQLRGPEAVDPATGEPRALFGLQRGPEGLSVPVPADRPVWILRLEREQATDLPSTVEEELTVGGERQIPVEEILRRLQAFEDAQARRLDHFSATNTTHLRFGAGAGQQSVEATLEGAFFFRQGLGFDWAWQRFFVNGVRWRGERIPEIPLIQPEKAAALPLEITFTREYAYRLVGSDTVDGRDAWVVEFRPAADAEDDKLYRGRVWIDKEHYARVRSRAVQLGLEGEVLSNEETLHYTPVTAGGESLPWSAVAPGGEGFVLPLRLTGQQLLSVVNATTLVERETILSDVEVNGPEFEERRLAVMASDATMVRDTERGLRYLVQEEGSAERVVQEEFDTGRLFALGGVFYDDALDYPLPLGGVNYFDFDFKETGNQLNAFFGGALLTVNYADPRLAGSRWDVGGDVFALAVPLTDQVYRGGEEVPGEEVERRTANVSVNAGRPLGSFVKLGAEYELTWVGYDSSDATAAEFTPPSDHLRHSVQLNGRFARSGYSLGLAGSFNRRSEWEPWGFAENPEFREDHEDYLLWSATLAKTWHLPGFQKIGAELVYAGGEDLDRFSKYGFGFFGDTRVQGYQSNRVRAEELVATHLSYGFEVGEFLRIDAVGDAAWATDEATGLQDELLAGVGVQGTFMGPWQTVVNLDVGVPV
ncbi:MAG: hypothetical protein ACLF0P_16260, partial [Thermoanaerobaculia bacterium]